MKTLIAAALLLSANAMAARFVVEAKRVLTDKEKKAFPYALEAFYPSKDPYISRLYIISGDVLKENLRRFSWVRKIEETPSLSALSLIPAPNSQRLVTDDLFTYQWSLFNQGQTFFKEKDDIHNIPVTGLPGKDIGWKDYYQVSSKERVIVAVMDSGVDVDHPDLKDNIYRNEAECGDVVTVDANKNGLLGDCIGWNFTEAITDPSARIVDDRDGHGTHVSGIIAAGLNGRGIVGVNPYAMIMPIKVMKDTNSKSQVATADAFARGILYAADSGASVINMSLGWPRSLETNYLRYAVTTALSKGVIIIAAAGNNNSSEPLFPCAYEGVICTAASSLDGNYSGFSNYGGHVDVVAPGEGILSLNPTLYEPEFFAVPGYDIKSGTSQAAPVVAGLVSLLRAQDPSISIDEVFARIYSASNRIKSEKYVLGGEASWEAFSRPSSGPVVRPVLKRVRQLSLQGNRPVALTIPLRNFGLPTTTPVKISLESLSPGVEIDAHTVSIESLSRSESRDLVFPIKVTDVLAEANLRVKVNIDSETGRDSFVNEIPVVRLIDPRNDRDLRKFPVISTVDVGALKENALSSYLTTLDSYGHAKTHELFVRKMVKAPQRMELTILSRTDTGYESKPTVTIDQAIALVNFKRVDLNLDGVEDYFIQTVVEEKGERNFLFTFLDASMRPLWSEFNNVKVNIDVTVAKLTEFQFVSYVDPKLGQILVPVFFTNGQLPKLDQKKDFYGRYDSSREDRLYYLQPDHAGKNFRIRTLTTNQWKEEIKAQLKSKWSETVNVEQLLPLSDTDLRNREVRVIFNVGERSKRQLFIAAFTAQGTRRGITIPQLVLQTEDVAPLNMVSPEGLRSSGDVYLNVYDRSRAKIVSTSGVGQTAEIDYDHKGETDPIIGHIASFIQGPQQFTVLQSREQLISLSAVNGKITKTERPKLRYSFLSSKLLSAMYSPVILKRTNEQKMALYVDATSVTGNRIYLFEEQNGKLVSTIRNSLSVPQRCKVLNPNFNIDSQSHEYVFLCVEEDQLKNQSWFIRTYPMN